MAQNPLLRLVLRAEKAASGPVNRASNSGEAADLLLLASKAGRVAIGVGDRLRGVAVHALALPSHRDLQLLEAKVERLQRAIDELAARGRDDVGGGGA